MDGVLALQRTAGNRAVSHLLIQRLQKPYSANDWKTASTVKIALGPATYARSAALRAVDTAVAVFDAKRGKSIDEQLGAVVGVLKAIIAWKATKADPSTTKRAVSMRALEQSYFDHGFSLLDQKSSQERATWDPGLFTDPKQHDPSSFTYLINAVAEYPSGAPAYITKTLDDPTQVANALLSMSVISESKQGFFSPSGFILKVPKENVFSSSPGDAGVQNKEAFAGGANQFVEIARVYAANGIKPPSAVLQLQTGQYNEINAIGRSPTTGAAAEVIGIFVLVDPGKESSLEPLTLYERAGDPVKKGAGYLTPVCPKPSVTPARMDHYRKKAKELGITIVPIAVPKERTKEIKAHAGNLFGWHDRLVLVDACT